MGAHWREQGERRRGSVEAFSHEGDRGAGSSGAIRGAEVRQPGYRRRAAVHEPARREHPPQPRSDSDSGRELVSQPFRARHRQRHARNGARPRADAHSRALAISGGGIAAAVRSVTEDPMRSVHARALVVIAALLLPVGASAQSIEEFFDDSVVRDLRLTINSRDWSALKENFRENIYYPCSLQWEGTTVRNVGIRSRGLGSRSNVKPGLRVDLDRYAVDQTFAGMKSFVLDNLVQDKSMLKERLAMAVFRRLGLPAPREAHARLYINNQYVGLYAVVETIDKGFLARSFGQDSEGRVENDGYLFEYDYVRDYRFEYLGSNLDEYKIFDPKTNENRAAAQIWGPIEDMFQVMNEAPNATF